MVRRNTDGASRGASITLRISDKSKYLVDLAARKRRCSLSAIVEQAIICFVEEIFNDSADCLIRDLYDIDELTKIKKLKALRPSYLTFEEELILKQEKEKDD